jgi:hypothetical protein
MKASKRKTVNARHPLAAQGVNSPSTSTLLEIAHVRPEFDRRGIGCGHWMAYGVCCRGGSCVLKEASRRNIITKLLSKSSFFT